jgi:hypothetical protein
MSSRKYMINGKKYKITLLTTLFIFMLSTIVPALTFAQPEAVSGKDWEHIHGNSWGHNNSPQTQINAGNVDALEVKWMFPIGGSSLSPTFISDLGATEGTPVPPIIKDGVVYILTGWLRIYAVNMETGKADVWDEDYQYEVDIDDAAERLPIDPAGPHMHGWRYWAKEDALLMPGMACDYKVIDAQTGEEKYTIGPWCTNIPGSIYPYRGWKMGLGTAELGTYEAGELFIGGQGGTEPGTLKEGRGHLWAIDMNNPDQVVWRVWNQPPQDRPVDDWALQECDVGWFFTIPCSEVRAESPTVLDNDWQMNPGETVHWSTGTTSMWGQPSIDEDTGYVYVNTGNVSPFFYTEYRPGPNLYSAVLMAVDMNTGQRAWWVQDVPRDPWDYDCNWSGMLVDDTSLGKVWVKGCKIGWLHVRDAITGDTVHYIEVRQDMDDRGGLKRTDQLGAVEPLDPHDEFIMKEWVMRDTYPAPPAFQLVPGWWHGTFGTDPAYNDGNVIHYIESVQATVTEWAWPELPELVEEGQSLGGSNWPTGNATIVSRDLVTGEVNWTNFFPWSNVRAFPTVTGSMVIAPHPDGILRFYDEDNGELLREMNLGGPMIIGSTIGMDSAGDAKIFVNLGNPTFGGPGFDVGSNIPGTVVAIGLNERAAAQVRTTTVTTTATTTTTTTTRITTATTTTVTTATTQTVTTTARVTTTSTLAAQTETVTSQAAAQTVTAEVTEEVGLSSTITYAAIAVAVIAVIAAAVLTTRKT